MFHLEVYSNTQQLLLYNLTAEDVPLFDVRHLAPATSFTLSLYASNSKGRSNNLLLNVVTSPLPEQDARKG